MAVIYIYDTGIGIPLGGLPYTFERFYWFDKVSPQSEVSSGLGLAIAKQVTEIHGGMIKVESKVSTGNIFRMYIPLSGNTHVRDDNWHMSYNSKKNYES